MSNTTNFSIGTGQNILHPQEEANLVFYGLLQNSSNKFIIFGLAFPLTLLGELLTSGDNLANNLRAAFTIADPKSVKKIDNLTVPFMLLESVHVKAACRTLMKWTPGVNLTNILRADFSFSEIKICVCIVMANENWQKDLLVKVW